MNNETNLKTPDVGVGSGDLFGIWIDVRKQVPPKGQPVLVVYNESSVPFVAWRDCDFPDYQWRDAEWVVFDDEDVTHWMPMPALPNIQAEPRHFNHET